MSVKKTDTVKVHYTGRLDDGTVFDSSREGEPLEFTLGSRHVIRGFEKAVESMSIGETKTVRVPMNDAYGPRNEDLAIRVDRAKFPPSITPELGLHLQLRQPDGSILNVQVTEITDDYVIIDANHPFAGKDLNFEMKLVGIGDEKTQ
ncbi:MAG: peptidylprolyl isomerase [Thermodesulfovibrionales bacterium]|nr:peptidylprolyl isomerase [Thermodesulfovibrionales bacterium]